MKLETGLLLATQLQKRAPNELLESPRDLNLPTIGLSPGVRFASAGAAFQA